VNASQKKASTEPARRIFLLDDHPLTRQGMTQLLNGEPDLKVCGEAENASKALTLVGASHPDLVLADITLPTKSGLEFIKDMKALHPELPVLVMSMHDEKAYAQRALRAGARGYVMKTEDPSNLLAAIREVLAGRIHVSREFSQNLLKSFTANDLSSEKGTLNELSDREFEIYQLIGRGLDTGEIARRLNISTKTVECHRVALKKKLNLKSALELNTHAVRWAVSNQMI
jgi:DNA-binding NarL/FixJ family response regulator